MQYRYRIYPSHRDVPEIFFFYYSSLISYDFSWFPSKSKIVPLESNLFSSNIRFVPIEVWEYMTLTWCLTQIDLTGFSAFDQSSSEFARHEGVERENSLLHRSRQFRPFARRCFFFTLPQCMFQYILQRWTRFESLFSKSFVRSCVPWCHEDRWSTVMVIMLIPITGCDVHCIPLLCYY